MTNFRPKELKKHFFFFFIFFNRGNSIYNTPIGNEDNFIFQPSSDAVVILNYNSYDSRSNKKSLHDVSI